MDPEVERAMAGVCPLVPTESDGRHAPVLLPDGTPERAILPGDVFVCRFCRALYWPETSSEWRARIDGLAPAPEPR